VLSRFRLTIAYVIAASALAVAVQLVATAVGHAGL
jgi:hypothetical protein